MNRAPIVRLVSWPATTVTLSILVAAIIIGWLITRSPTGVWLACGIYLVYSIGSRRIVTSAHRRGIRLMQSGQYAEAMEPFHESLILFTRYPWIDRIRALVLLSPSAMSYREMAMCNLAFCHSQIGQGAEAKAMYRAVLHEYPDNQIAVTALKMIEAGQQLGQPTTDAPSPG